MVRAFATMSVKKIRERLAAQRQKEEDKKDKKEKKAKRNEERARRKEERKRRNMVEISDDESLYECEDDLKEVEAGAEADNEEGATKKQLRSLRRLPKSLALPKTLENLKRKKRSQKIFLNSSPWAAQVPQGDRKP